MPTREQHEALEEKVRSIEVKVDDMIKILALITEVLKRDNKSSD